MNVILTSWLGHKAVEITVNFRVKSVGNEKIWKRGSTELAFGNLLRSGWVTDWEAHKQRKKLLITQTNDGRWVLRSEYQCQNSDLSMDERKIAAGTMRAKLHGSRFKSNNALNKVVGIEARWVLFCSVPTTPNKRIMFLWRSGMSKHVVNKWLCFWYQ